MEEKNAIIMLVLFVNQKQREKNKIELMDIKYTYRVSKNISHGLNITNLIETTKSMSLE